MSSFKITVTMQAFMILSTVLLATLATAQKQCTSDGDCGRDQYCYLSSHLCANYTICGRFNREETAAPVRHANQCGPCLPGYYAEKITSGKAAEAESCTSNLENEQTESGNWWQVAAWGGGGAMFVLIVSYFIRVWIRSKPACGNNMDPEQPANVATLALANVCPSAPPVDDPIQQNNNLYYESEEDKLLHQKTIIGEQRDSVTFTNVTPVKAQPYHPPDWVNTDSTYNPEDNQAVTNSGPPEAYEEETMTSNWTPGEPDSVPEHPFAGVNPEQENRANNALDRLACPSPSTGDESPESRQSNGAAGGNSTRYETNGNRRGNINTSAIQIQQFQINYVVNQGGGGS